MPNVERTPVAAALNFAIPVAALAAPVSTLAIDVPEFSTAVESSLTLSLASLAAVPTPVILSAVPSILEIFSLSLLLMSLSKKEGFSTSKLASFLPNKSG